MKNRFKKIAVILASTLISSSLFVGCNSNKTDVKSTTSIAGESLLNVDVYLDYNWWSMATPFDESNKISKYIMDTQHIKLNFRNPSGDEREKLNIMIATNSLPDVIVMDRNDMYKKMISLKDIIPIDSYIDKYKGFKSMVDAQAINMSKVDGKTYSFLNWSNNKKWGGFGRPPVINEKIYKELGSPKLDTLDDLTSYLGKVKNANMKVNGKNVVPLQFSQNSAYPGALSVYFGDTNPIDYQLKNPNYISSAKLMNEYFTKQYINQDAFLEKKEQIDQKLSTGRVAVLACGDDLVSVQKANSALKASGSDVTYTTIPAFGNGDRSGKDVIYGRYTTLGWDSVCITKAAKEPERIAKFFDWMASAEGQRVVLFGPKGDLWDKTDKDGYPILKVGKSLHQTTEENKLLPLYNFELVGNSAWYDNAKLRINRALPKDKRDYIVSQQDDLKLNRYLRDGTEFLNVAPDVSGAPETLIANDVNEYLKNEEPKLVTASSQGELMKQLDKMDKDVMSKGYQKVLDYENKVWESNKKILGIK